MKKSLKQIIVLFLIVLIVCTSISIANAETIYYYNGYMYTFINNEKVSIYGVQEEITNVIPPDTINGRYVVDIRNRAFMDNAEILSVDLSQLSSLDRIGSFAFMGCINLDGEVVIPDTVITMETAAFQGCTSLDSVVFNASTGIVPNQCFSGCASLSSVTLNDTVTEIGYYAFANCPNLSYIEIPTSVTSIAQSSFQNDTGITLGVYRNSYALEYAENNNINYVILDPEPTEEPTQAPTAEPTQPVTEAPTQAPVAILGDVDGDGSVSTIDATVMQRYLASVAYPAGCNFTYGDVDGDGVISILDVTYIMRYLAGIDVPYPVNEPIQNQ